MRLRELAVVALLAAAGPARAGAPLSLAEAVERALEQSPEVRAAAAEVRAARARLAGASTLLSANPEISAAAGARDGPGGRSAEWEVAISQRVELGGQRGARVSAARAALGAAEARLEAARGRISAETRERVGRAAAARLRGELAAEAQRLAEDAARAAERRLQAGDVARVEVIGARLERGRAVRAALEAEQGRLAALAELELLLGAEPGTAPEVALELEAGDGAPARAADELVQEALGARRDVAAARLEVAAAEAEARAAERSVIPTPALGVSVAREERADIVLGTLSFELPVFSRAQAERGVASARLEQARLALGALERRTAQEVRLAAARVRAAHQVLAAFDAETRAAMAEELALVTRAYEAGKLEYVRYQLLRREALEARRDRIDALEAMNDARARLERAVGSPGPGRAPGTAPR